MQRNADLLDADRVGPDPNWDTYLSELELCLDERAQLLQSVASRDQHETLFTFTAPGAAPTQKPNPAQRSRASSLQSCLTHQELEIEVALRSLAIEIERVERLREAQLSRVVTEINAGGFEARA